MKEILIGIVKACIFIATLLLFLWVSEGFKMPTRIDIAIFLSISAILRHFVDREMKK